MASTRPVFGFIFFGGPLSGALVRDVRLANELSRRGHDVHVWWAMDREKDASLAPEIRQRWLFHGFRYTGAARGVRDAAGRALTACTADKKRARSAQKRPEILRRVMDGLIRQVIDGVDRDRRLVDRFAGELEDAGVTHLLPMLAILCPFAAAAQRRARDMRYLVTFQGYELYVNYARAAGLDQDLFARFRDVVAGAGWPAIAVSDDYVRRVAEDIGIDPARLHGIPPGIPPVTPLARDDAVEQIARKFRQYRPDVPLVTYLGRRDTEKGIDLLLYAVAILRARGVDVQLAIVGPTLFGTRYADVCVQLAEDLRCPVLWSNRVSDELRGSLFAASRCIVYPSIHREPFGMVPVEALAHGTPAVVPDYGGVRSTVEAAGATGGLRFRVWDSGDLAEQIGRIVADDDLHRRLAEAGPRIAEHYSVERLGERVLEHLGLQASDNAAEDPAAQVHVTRGASKVRL